MVDMLVKLYNIPRSHDIEENLFKSGIRIKKALAPDRSRIIAFSRTCNSGRNGGKLISTFLYELDKVGESCSSEGK